VPGRASSVKWWDGRGWVPISQDGVAVHPDCWCVCLCYLHFAPKNPEDGKQRYDIWVSPRWCPHMPTQTGGGETQLERNVGAPTCLRKQEVGKPSWNATQPCARVRVLGCVNDELRADGLRKGWGFWVSTWNVDSLTGGAGEVVEALSDRKADVTCIQET